MKAKNKLPRINNKITTPKVRLILPNGEMEGVVDIAEALEKAKENSLDLVEISPNTDPVVCKILDFGRYKYDIKKKASLNKKKQKKTSLKEMKFKVNIGQGDFDVKTNRIRKFLEDGDKVKVSLWFKGREIVHKQKGIDLFNNIIVKLGDIARVDQEPKFEGKQIIMILSQGVINNVD
ncbi:MAG TPA: translation initiation factor IF-3 [Candidatus Megaira endosymbiont of Hartmannula sinica]|nr:translation initiation factor IF-3 [Candidatus Megaera endosymbiont of Hartmannula sinica]